MDVKLLIAQYFDNVASCSLVDFPGSKTVQKCFDHECNFHWLQRRQFQAVEDQELQNLRHRAYYAQDMVGPGVEEERLMNSSIVSTILSSGMLWTAVWRSANLVV